MTEENERSDVSDRLIIAVVVLVIGALAVAGGFYFMNLSEGGGRAGYNTVVNENFGLSFSYPSSWRFDNYLYPSMYIVSITENSVPKQSTSKNLKAQVQIYAGDLGYPPLDNLENNVTVSMENGENTDIIGGVERITVDGVPGIDLSYRSYMENQNGRNRVRVLRKENTQYFIYYFVRENFYEDFSQEVNSIVDNFNLL